MEKPKTGVAPAVPVGPSQSGETTAKRRKLTLNACDIVSVGVDAARFTIERLQAMGFEDDRAMANAIRTAREGYLMAVGNSLD